MTHFPSGVLMLYALCFLLLLLWFAFLPLITRGALGSLQAQNSLATELEEQKDKNDGFCCIHAQRAERWNTAKREKRASARRARARVSNT